jgi:hypothetical protein
MRKHDFVDITDEWNVNEDGWKTVDLLDYLPDIPGYTVGVSIYFQNVDAELNRYVGIKHPSDTYPEKGTIRGRMGGTFTGGCNTSLQVDVYLTKAHADCRAFIIATWDHKATFLRDADQLSKASAVTDNWEEWDLSSKVPDGVRWVFIDCECPYNDEVNCRPYGSSWEQVAYFNTSYMHFLIPCSVDRKIETHHHDHGIPNWRLVGYLEDSLSNIKLNPAELDGGGTGVDWEFAAIDLDDEIIPSDAMFAALSFYSPDSTKRNFFPLGDPTYTAPQPSPASYQGTWSTVGCWPVSMGDDLSLHTVRMATTNPKIYLWGFIQAGIFIPTANELMNIKHPFTKTPIFNTQIAEQYAGGLGLARTSLTMKRYQFTVNLRYNLRSDAIAFKDWFNTQKGMRGTWVFKDPLDLLYYNCRFLHDEIDLVWETNNKYNYQVQFLGTPQ